MKIYFLSKQPCALYCNGVYAGTTDEFFRFTHLSLSDKVSICFQAENALPIHFFLTENIRFSPPEKVAVCLLKDALLLYAHEFVEADFTLLPIYQHRFPSALVSVFKQGRIQLTLQSSEGFFNATLPPSFARCTVENYQDLFVLSSPTQIAVFDKQCKRLLLENADSHRLEKNILTIVSPLNDCYLRTAEKRYLLDETACRLQENVLTPKLGNPPIPYAFFESFLIGEICDELLSNELLAEKEKLARFLGDFVAVCLTEDINTCALIRKKAERLFEADYFTVKIENNKITEITG